EEAAFADAGRALARLLGAEEGFRGTSQDYHLVDRVSLARTVETRQGLPLTLSAVYAGVARRVGVEAGLLPFPGHVLVAIGHGPGRVVLDPFASGDEVSREACERRLAELGAPPSPRWLLPATDRDMVVRQIRNLVSAMERHDRIGDARRLRLLLDAAIR
ncbi:MAG: transglutaminase-like domain-containing protein, partial [Planctomycetota bacterium]